MFVIRYLSSFINPAPRQADPVPAPKTGAGAAGRRASRKMTGHARLFEAPRLKTDSAIFEQPRLLEIENAAAIAQPPLQIVSTVLPREAEAICRDAVRICMKLLKPHENRIFTVADVFEKMEQDVARWFMDNRTKLLYRIGDPARRGVLSTAEIAALLIGEVLAIQAAGSAAGIEVAGAVARVKSVLEMLVGEVAGSACSVVETEPTYVGETFHILAAALMRNERGRRLKIKTPPLAVSDAYSHRFNAFVGGIKNADLTDLVGRANRDESTDIAKANLTPLMLAGNQKKAGNLRDALLSSLEPETIEEIRACTLRALQGAGMSADSHKLGIFIRNINPQGNGGTRDPAGNTTRERFLDILHAADRAGIRDIVLLGDAPGADWLAGTPWEPRSGQVADTRRKRTAAAAAAAGDARHVADLTTPWSANGRSPLFDSTRRHIPTTTVHDSGPEAENSLQGGYAEQLAMYHQLHDRLGMVGVVGNRSGIIDGPGFLGVPCVQMVTRAPFPQESAFDRLGLLSTIIPTYNVLSLETPHTGGRRPDGGFASPNLQPAQSGELQRFIQGFVEMRSASAAGDQ